MSKLPVNLLLSLLAGAFLGLAWLFPGEATGALLGWLSVICFVIVALSDESPLWYLLLGGALSHCLAFYWLNHTISMFGGFGVLPTTLLFTFFVGISALQFFLFGVLVRFINNDAKHLALTTPLAWCTLEYIIFRIFPWQFGHTQLGFLSFAQIADIGGVILISFLMFWAVEAVFRYFYFEERSVHFLLPVILVALSVSYGRYRIEQFSEPEGQKQKIAIVQANVSIEDKHDIALIAANADRYRALSEAIPGPDTLVIWPESVITNLVNTLVGSVGNDPALPFFDSNNSLLLGALTVDPAKRIHNSALAILNSGTVLEPYHKQILMPFGEYMPLANIFPWLLAFNPNIANFSPGTTVKVFEYPMITADDAFYDMRVSPLICYEDIVSNLSRDAVRSGAELLVNLTNDGWFGDSAAPKQHNQIASFRAIENRRFLARSTNTGWTTLISPTGETVQSLPTFSEGTLLAEVTLMGYTSLYTGFVGDRCAWFLVLLTLTFAVYHFAFKKV